MAATGIEAGGHPAQLAKGALRRLAQTQREPTPENFARAYAEEAGSHGQGAMPAAPSATVVAGPPAVPAAASAPPAWGALIERLARNLERGGKQWTAARRKDSLHRVLDSSRQDEARLAQRIQGLLQAWEADRPLADIEPLEPQAHAPAEPAQGLREADRPPGADPPARGGRGGAAEEAARPDAPRDSHEPAAGEGSRPLVGPLAGAVVAGLESADVGAAKLARRLAALGSRWASAGAVDAQARRELLQACAEAERAFARHHEFVRQLKALAEELSHGLVDLAEDESWARGASQALREQVGQACDARALRAAAAVLADTRARQVAAKRERSAARQAFKELLAGMVDEVGALRQQAGGFESAIERHASAVAEADSLEGLTSVVQALLADSRRIRAAVQTSNERLQRDQARAQSLEHRVGELEQQLKQLADEAHTDALTQVANRRGLELRFANECEQARSAQEPLAVGLVDIDNFKKLNDRLGHAAGDSALKALAAAVRERLRPTDHVARFGGEEFVVLLRGLAPQAAQQALTRLQRSLSASLFLHEGEEVFVTFSAGVTQWREGESLESALERADAGLYEAKRSGKNRTCTG